MNTGKKRLSKIVLLCLITISLLVTGCGAQKTAPNNSAAPAASAASKFPEKDIIVTYQSKAGSSGDIFLRNMGKAIQSELNGKAWVVENREGASGANAFLHVKKAKADGYSLLGVSSTLVSAPLLSDMPVSYKDFEAVCGVVIDPLLIYVRADKPWKDLKELIADAKANPGKQSWGRGTPSGSNTVAQLMLQKATGVDVKPVAFTGGSELLTAVLGGHVDVGNGEYAELKGQIEAGKIRILATLTEDKLKLLPKVATAKEQGFNVVVHRPRGIMAPKGTPKETLDKLQAIIKKALDNPDFQKQLDQDGCVANWLPSDKFMAVLDDIHKSYVDLDLKNIK